MAGDQYFGADISCKAENDFADKQFYAVELTGADLQVDVCDGAADLVYGILQNDPPEGAAANVRRLGITKWVSDGSGTPITVGAKVGTNNVGKCVIKSGAGDFVAGTALSVSSADGTVILVDLTPNAIIHA